MEKPNSVSFKPNGVSSYPNTIFIPKKCLKNRLKTLIGKRKRKVIIHNTLISRQLSKIQQIGYMTTENSLDDKFAISRVKKT
jgi:hypothetical protein